MSVLKVYAADGPQTPLKTLSDGDAIAAELDAVGVRFERWEADAPLPLGAPQEDVLQAYRKQVDKLKAECGFATADVISLKPDNPNREELRKKFLSEHAHTEDEVRFFVDGKGLFCLHIGDKVFAVLCEKQDLISVPAGTRHWFDMGPEPELTCIRLFTNPEGWVANYTGAVIADGFPRFPG